MADLVFNIAKGKIAYYAGLPAAADELVVIPLEATGLEADATLKDYDDVASLLAGASNEQTTMGRKHVSAAVTVTVDDVNDWVSMDMPDQTWAAAAGNPVGGLLIAYDGDTGSGTDANLVPLAKLDFAVTPDGSDIVWQLNAAGFARAS